MTTIRSTLLACTVTLLTACTTAGAPGSPSPTDSARAAQSGERWNVETREHVDLWLHGYALLQQDTAEVPFFRRGYRDRMLSERRSRNITSALDVDRERLISRLTTNPALVNGQFLALYFASLDDLRRAVDLTIRVQGDPRNAPDLATAQFVALVSASFPSAADRDWLRTFMQAVVDEHRVFYRDYWASQQSARTATRAAVNTIWNRYRPAFQRYLANSQQGRGEMLLSLPLNGEGRVAEVSNGYFVVGVNYPESPDGAAEPLYTFAHEMVLATTNIAVADNITPAQQRSGVAAGYTSNAAVRGGLLLIERLAPDLAAGYMRYYLAAAGERVPAGDPRRAFESTFSLPTPIVTAIQGQLDSVLAGI